MGNMDVICALDGAAVVGELERLAVNGSLDGVSPVMVEFDGAAAIGASDGAAVGALDGADELGGTEGATVIGASDGGAVVGDN